MTPTSAIRVRNQIDAICSVAANGIEDCYENFDEYFTDFWMDFSWMGREMKEEVQAVLDSPSFTDAHNIIFAKYNFDLRAEMIKGRDFDPHAPFTQDDE